MGYAATPASLQQGRRNLRGALEVLDLLWLDSHPDIEEDLPVPVQTGSRATTSRALAQTVRRSIMSLLARLTDAEAASEQWVEAHRERAQVELKSYENVSQRSRPLFRVSFLFVQKTPETIDDFGAAANSLAAFHSCMTPIAPSWQCASPFLLMRR
jgi:hypothetical protein